MAVRRCPECGGRLSSNYCDICMRKVPFAGVKPQRRRDPWEYSSAHREEANHECITFDMPQTNGKKQTFQKPKPKTRKSPDNQKAKVIALIVVVLSLIPTVIGFINDMQVDAPVPEYNLEAFATETDLPAMDSVGLYSNGEITITADALGLYYGEPALSIQIDNASDQNIDVVVENVVVNSYIMGSGMLVETDAGDTSRGFLGFYDYELKKAGIEEIAQISLRLRIYERYDYDEIACVEQVIIETEAADTYTQSVDRSGMELYNDGSVCILLRDFTMSGYGDGEMELFLENLSGKDVLVNTTGIFLNGQESSGYFSSMLLPGTRTIGSVYLYELEHIDIQELNQVEVATLDLVVEYMDGWDVVESNSCSATFTPADIH